MTSTRTFRSAISSSCVLAGIGLTGRLTTTRAGGLPSIGRGCIVHRGDSKCCLSVIRSELDVAALGGTGANRRFDFRPANGNGKICLGSTDKLCITLNAAGD